MASLTWWLCVSLLPFRARVGSTAGLRRGRRPHEALQVPTGAEGPSLEVTGPALGPREGTLRTAVGQSRPGREAAKGGPVCSPPALGWPAPPLAGWQLRRRAQAQARPGLGRPEAPSCGRLPEPSCEPRRKGQALEGSVFLNAHISFVSPLTFFLFHNSHTTVAPTPPDTCGRGTAHGAGT